MKKMLDKGKILFGDDDNKIIEIKLYADEFEDKLSSLIVLDGRLGSYNLRELFPNIKKIFDNPKPIDLLTQLFNFVLYEEDIVLDFFGGSCATAHAVINRNKEDGGNRKFIMVQLPEPCAPDTEAYKAGYKTIADIGKERIRRVIKKIKDEQEQKKDLFSGDKHKLDLGFKVFKLEPSNFKLWNDQVAKEKDAIKNQLEMFVEHINPKSSQEDILYELLLKSGFPLTTKIEQLTMTDKVVFSIDEGAMLICLEKDLTPEIIKAMAEKKPVRVICLDEGFHGNDQLKTNAVQIMKSREITFRTV
jgi:adenine-specific DNA-methyltransferase